MSLNRKIRTAPEDTAHPVKDAIPGIVAGLLVSILFALVRDGGRTSLPALAFLAGSLSALSLAIMGLYLGALWLRRRIGPRRDAWFGWAVLIVAPGLYGFQAVLAGALTAGYLGAVAGGMACTAALGGLLYRYLPSGFSLPGVLWATVCCLLFGWVHYDVGTMAAVRPGTEALHVAMFLGTWFASAALAAAPMAGAVVTGRVKTAAIAGAIVVAGGILGEADRRFFVGQYPAIHAWLAVSAFAMVGVGIAAAWPLFGIPARIRRNLAIAIGALLLLSTMSLFITARGNLTTRAAIRRSSLGGTLLSAFPTPESAAPNRAVRIHYPRYLDQRLKGGPYNVLLISVDALRHDAVSRMPVLKQFAKRSLRFSNAWAAGPRTVIGVNTLLLGRYAAQLKWDLWVLLKDRVKPRSAFSPKERLALKRGTLHTVLPRFGRYKNIAERFRENGYSTFAVPFGGGNRFFAKGVGFDRGFDRFVDLTPTRWKRPTSQKQLKIVKEVMGEQRSPWFGWLHFYDPHDSRRKKSKYRKLCKEFDVAFGELLEFMSRRDLLKDTIIAVTADHGEGFGEHGRFGHGASLHQELIHIPIILNMPTVKPKRVTAPVSGIDVATTLLAATGGDAATMTGINLLAYRKQPPRELRQRPVFSEVFHYFSHLGRRTADVRAVRVGRFKLINNRKDQTVELFNLRADPKERQSIAETHPERVDELMGLLNAHTEREREQKTLP